jgi:hypothetical protein
MYLITIGIEIKKDGSIQSFKPTALHYFFMKYLTAFLIIVELD